VNLAQLRVMSRLPQPDGPANLYTPKAGLLRTRASNNPAPMAARLAANEFSAIARDVVSRLPQSA